MRSLVAMAVIGFAVSIAASQSARAEVSGNWAGSLTISYNNGTDPETCETVGMSFDRTAEKLTITEDWSACYENFIFKFEADIQGSDLYFKGAKVGSFTDDSISLTDLHSDPNHITVSAEIAVKDNAMTYSDTVTYDGNPDYHEMSAGTLAPAASHTREASQAGTPAQERHMGSCGG